MIVIGTKLSDTKVKVDGCFIDGSQVGTIDVTAEPPKPEPKFGKNTELYLNPTTGELFWDYVDRPLTAEEKIIELEQRNTDLELAMAEILGGVPNA